MTALRNTHSNGRKVIKSPYILLRQMAQPGSHVCNSHTMGVNWDSTVTRGYATPLIRVKRRNNNVNQQQCITIGYCVFANNNNVLFNHKVPKSKKKFLCQ
jgi:hypothetical protein